MPVVWVTLIQISTAVFDRAHASPLVGGVEDGHGAHHQASRRALFRLFLLETPPICNLGQVGITAIISPPHVLHQTHASQFLKCLHYRGLHQSQCVGTKTIILLITAQERVHHSESSWFVRSQSIEVSGQGNCHA